MSVEPPHDQNVATQLSDALDGLAGAIAIGLITVTLADRQSLPRILLTLAFACYVPGRAIVSNWPRLARWSEAAVSMIFSLALLTLIATVTLWAHYWHPVGLFQAEAGASLLALGLALARRHPRLAGQFRGRPRRAVVRPEQP